MFHPLQAAIAGDIIGSVYEWNAEKSTNFPLFSAESRFTDDTVMTIAIAEVCLNPLETNYVQSMKNWGRKYPNAGYGGAFGSWLQAADSQPYGSWGNGSAMRVSAIGWAFDSLQSTMDAAAASAAVTHNHPEGIKGAQATAAAIFLARTGAPKAIIGDFISDEFGYDLNRRLDEIRLVYKFDVSCQGSVPEALLAFLESDDYEHAIRLAVSLGGDADTQACIAGSVAGAFYREMPPEIEAQAWERLPEEMRAVVEAFTGKFFGS
jgi:ADP-ribosylglycohydrolase